MRETSPVNNGKLTVLRYPVGEVARDSYVSSMATVAHQCKLQEVCATSKVHLARHIDGNEDRRQRRTSPITYTTDNVGGAGQLNGLKGVDQVSHTLTVPHGARPRG